ncbi:unnamed protein product [Ilex paraguariensis]|uniref:Uncharacterized protein n=1 Tax=Ilex paraguariensis TaxID=185542 RepID=A0ABC8T232_9AQUA
MEYHIYDPLTPEGCLTEEASSFGFTSTDFGCLSLLFASVVRLPTFLSQPRCIANAFFWSWSLEVVGASVKPQSTFLLGAPCVCPSWDGRGTPKLLHLVQVLSWS